MPTFNPRNPTEMIHNLKTPLSIIRSHNKHLLEAYDKLSERQMLTLLKAIQAQTILLEHLLTEMAGYLARLDNQGVSQDTAYKTNL